MPADDSIATDATEVTKLRRRRLGRTGLELTELTLGTWGLASGAYGDVAEDAFAATVRAALAAGIRSFDMAPLWGDGRSERVVAEVVGSRRAECTYITRVGLTRTPASATDPATIDIQMDPKSIAAGFERSLERLGTDYVDVLLLHDPPPKVLAEGGWAKALAQLKGQGRVRAWGVSAATAAQAREAMSLGAEVLCMPYALLRGDELSELADEIDRDQVGLITRSPLLHGLLTGRYEAGHRFLEGDHRAARWTQDALDRRIAQVLALRFLVQNDVPSLRAAALRFALANPEVSSVAVGPRSEAQLDELVREVGRPPYLTPELCERVPQVLATFGA
jgi:aryl-alcohol dehydrogenase-like predicted oxidoreductase